MFVIKPDLKTFLEHVEMFHAVKIPADCHENHRITHQKSFRLTWSTQEWCHKLHTEPIRALVEEVLNASNNDKVRLVMKYGAKCITQ